MFLLSLFVFQLNSDIDLTDAKIQSYNSVPGISSTDVLEIALSCKNGMTVLNCESNYTNTPASDALYMPFLVLRRTLDDATIIMFGYNSGSIYINVYVNSAWIGWQTK